MRKTFKGIQNKSLLEPKEKSKPDKKLAHKLLKGAKFFIFFKNLIVKICKRSEKEKQN